MSTFYIHIRFGLNCRNLQKAEKLRTKIEQTIQLNLNNSEFTEQDDNQFDLTGYFEMEYPTKEEALFNWLFHLELIGYNWQIKAPHIYEDFFSFEGERWSNEQNFIVSGLTFASFELTDRTLDYYDFAPLKEDDNVTILESELTKEQGIVGLDGVILSIGNRTDGIWNFSVHIAKLGTVYMLTEQQLTATN